MRTIFVFIFGTTIRSKAPILQGEVPGVITSNKQQRSRGFRPLFQHQLIAKSYWTTLPYLLSNANKGDLVWFLDSAFLVLAILSGHIGILDEHCSSSSGGRREKTNVMVWSFAMMHIPDMPSLLLLSMRHCQCWRWHWHCCRHSLRRSFSCCCCFCCHRRHCCHHRFFHWRF